MIKKRLAYFLYAIFFIALPLNSFGKFQNVLLKADTQTGALHGLFLANDTSMNWILCADGSQYQWVDSKYGWGLGNLTANETEYKWTIPTDVQMKDNQMYVKYTTENIEIHVSREWNKDGNLE